MNSQKGLNTGLSPMTEDSCANLAIAFWEQQKAAKAMNSALSDDALKRELLSAIGVTMSLDELDNEMVRWCKFLEKKGGQNDTSK